jgi:serine/threonine-protein kinase
MSPEQIRDARSVDARADVWSMGVILYELLTAICPFDAETPGAIFSRIVTEADNPRPISNVRADVPPVLDRIVGRCMQRNREERFANVLELAHAIAPVIGPPGLGAVERIVAALSRPRGPSTNLSDSSGAMSRITDPIPHRTNVSWTGGARSGSNRIAVGAALGVAAFALLGVTALIVVRHRAPTAVPAAMPAESTPRAAPAAADTEPVASVPEVLSPAGVASALAPSASASSPPDSSAAPSGSAALPLSTHTASHPPPPAHTSKPSKQDLLRDRR